MVDIAGQKVSFQAGPRWWVAGPDTAWTGDQSKPDAVFMYSENNLMAVRWMEYKVHLRVFETHAPRRNLDETTVAEVGMSPWVYNLYMDPKEQASIGHSRFEWGVPQVLQRIGRHAATFATYPRKDIGLAKP